MDYLQGWILRKAQSDNRQLKRRFRLSNCLGDLNRCFNGHTTERSVHFLVPLDGSVWMRVVFEAPFGAKIGSGLVPHADGYERHSVRLHQGRICRWQIQEGLQRRSRMTTGKESTQCNE
jgi:hypothetical protein